VRLAANENPLGPSPRAVAVARAAAEELHRYPDGASLELRQALGRLHGLDPARLVCGAGSDELIAILAKYSKGKPEVIRASLPYIDPRGRLLVGDLYDQVRWYQGQKMVDAGVDPKSVVDLSFVKDHLDVPK